MQKLELRNTYTSPDVPLVGGSRGPVLNRDSRMQETVFKSQCTGFIKPILTLRSGPTSDEKIGLESTYKVITSEKN